MRTQQQNVYDAEDRCSAGDRFANIAEVQSYVDSLRDSWWWEEWYPNVRDIEVGPRRPGQRDSVGRYFEREWAGKIEMARHHWTERDVLHEVAHVLAEARFGSEAHDPDFCRVYLELVYLCRGQEAWQELKAAFDAGNVCYDERTGT